MIETVERERKKDAMDYIIDSFKQYNTNNPKCKRVNDYVNEIEEELKQSKLCYVRLEFETKQKFIAGWSPIYFITEVPLAWDLILDVPYIPSSTIKGIMRDAITEISNENIANCLLGSASGIGHVIFFDAYPVSAQDGLLTYDIINPHYNDTKKNEYEVQPVPIVFISVNKGVKFVTFIAFDKTANECVKDGNSMELILKSLLYSMKLGWGRRTGRGYGELDLSLDRVSLRCP
ncbi:MAG: type III-B CRISPR module RAMP protein Cmr6 [Sulfolobaceae archaeon]|nr:type III-B CRISPR module RAMP protein Cmr6 [Sulfolobaceae archaeon]